MLSYGNHKKNKRCFLTCLYRSPSQNSEQIQSFCDSFDIFINNITSVNPEISIITGYFNGKCSKWYSFDTSDNIGKELDTITSTAGYSQIIEKPTHFRNNSFSCIDLIFTSNPSILVDSGFEKLSLVVVIMISYMERLTLESLFLHHISGLFGITRILTLLLFSVL